MDEATANEHVHQINGEIHGATAKEYGIRGIAKGVKRKIED